MNSLKYTHPSGLFHIEGLQLYKHRSRHYNARSFEVPGGIAQLGERLHGMQEVSGSIPLTSTIGAEMVEVAGGNCLFLRPGGYSSAGRALAWHARGQRFDPAYLHQRRRTK